LASLLVVLHKLYNVYVYILQYYFGDINLLKDNFLQQEIQKDADGCIF